MPIGHCLAHSYRDAVQYCLLLDVFMVAIGLWTLNQWDWQDQIPEARTRVKVQTFGAALGLAATMIFRMDEQRYFAIAVLLAVVAAVVHAFSALSEWSYASAASEKADLGLVELSGWFWLAELAQYVFILILVLNHLLLAKYGREELRGHLMHSPVAREDDRKFRSGRDDADEVL